MLSSLSDPILPIFAILALGYCLYRLELFDVIAAQSINKFVFYVATPALIFSIVSSAPVSKFDANALGIYFMAQLCAYLGVFLLTHFNTGSGKKRSAFAGYDGCLC